MNIKAEKLSLGIGFCFAILPAIAIGLLIFKYSVNVPYYDQWAVGGFFRQLSEGKLGFDDLIAQHNESRKFFPRLIFLGLGKLTAWDVRYEMLVSFMLACLISLNIYRLNRLTVAGSLTKGLVIAFLTNLLIFSPVQFENWFWGIQIVVFIPITCIVTCISINYSSLTKITKFILSILLCNIATFSYANGILSWVILLPVIVLVHLKSWSDLPKQKRLVFGWLIGFTSNVVLYFYGYQKPDSSPSILEAIVHPFKAVQYFLCFLGSPLGWNTPIASVTNSMIIGGVAIAIFIISCIYILKHSQDYKFFNRTIPWIMIGLYAVISGLITTTGRVGFGIEQSLSSKYTTFSLYLIVSIIHLIPILFKDGTSRGYLSNQEIPAQIKTFLATALIFLHIQTFYYSGIRIMSLKSILLRGKACLLLINFEQDECQKIDIYGPGGDRKVIKNIANSLTKLNLLNPGLVKTNKVKDIIDISSDNQVDGKFERIKKLDNNMYLASGWAVLKNQSRPVDAVILTYDNSLGESTIFAVADLATSRLDISEKYQAEKFLNFGWERTFYSQEFAEDLVNIKAWVFDTNTGKVFPLPGVHVINNTKSSYQQPVF
ncbi:MAG: hypothetical protein QNJ68_18395 [Microcoleaceae cyanobacterium MO_207.B10]|nr:hypothetical protein [Microcoleaceae cyanobacterium MO_207.B10]